jgi:hypothetical protein
MTPPRLKKWPWDGDAPITRSRKCALGYKGTATAYQDALTAIREALALIDLRLINFDQPGAADIITKAIAAAAEVQTVEQLDERFTEWGETWHCPRPARYDDDDYVDAETAAEIMQLAPGTVHKFRTRRQLAGIWQPDPGGRGKWMFRVGDLYKLATERRRRGDNLKDRVASNTPDR